MAAPSSAEAVQRITTEPAVNLTVAATALGISAATASRLVACDKFPAPTIRLGARIVVPTPELRKLLQLSSAESAA